MKSKQLLIHHLITKFNIITAYNNILIIIQRFQYYILTYYDIKDMTACMRTHSNVTEFPND